jgi:hypothetical protein
MKIPKTFIDKFSVITEECTAIVQSMQTIDNRFFIADNNPRYIVPLRAFTIENKESIDTLLNETDDDFIEIELLYPFLLSGILWEDKVLDKLDLPVKGENLIATFTYSGLDELKCDGLVTLGKIKPIKYKQCKTKKDG